MRGPGKAEKHMYIRDDEHRGSADRAPGLPRVSVVDPAANEVLNGWEAAVSALHVEHRSPRSLVMTKRVTEVNPGDLVVALPYGCDRQSFRLGHTGEDPETRDWVRLYDDCGNFHGSVRLDQWVVVA